MTKPNKTDPIYPVIDRNERQHRVAPQMPVYLQQTFPGQPSQDMTIEVSGPVNADKIQRLRKLLGNKKNA